jgi:hypothetical protein
LYFFIVACLGNNNASPGMAHQYRLPLYFGERPFNKSYIIRQRSKRILNGDCLIALLLQYRDHLIPG